MLYFFGCLCESGAAARNVTSRPKFVNFAREPEQSEWRVIKSLKRRKNDATNSKLIGTRIIPIQG